MKILNFLFPFKLQLRILQLEGYDPNRYLKWIFKNYLVRKLEQKKDLVFTFKIKLLLTYSIIFFFLIFLISSSINILVATVSSVILLTQPFILYTLSVVLINFIEFCYKKYVIEKTRKKILSFKNLKIIAITGSYGKTSTKEILYQLLKDKYKVLRTPESFNTVLGISKVVDYELDGSYDYFICEMAAYHKGDIKELCFMVPPNYGMITGVASQHLERFGNIKNITTSKFELYDSVKDPQHFVFNLNNKIVSREVERLNIPDPSGYLKCFNVDFSINGSSFELENDGIKKIVRTDLFGYSSIENISGASAMALKLGVDFDYLIQRIKSLTTLKSRFNLRKYGTATIVDNTFSSNESAFRELINTAKKVKGKKILITPGLVELGNSSQDIHKILGLESEGVFDKVILVGKNERTLAFKEGLNEDVIFIPDSRKDYIETIDKYKNDFDWIFLENDLTENY